MKCTFCNGIITNYELNESYRKLFDILKIDEIIISKNDNPLYLIVESIVNSVDDDLLLFIQTTELNRSIFNKVQCSRCDSKDFWIYHSYLIYRDFYEFITNQAKKYLLEKLNNNEKLLNVNINSFHYTLLLLKIIKSIDEIEYKKLHKIYELSNKFHPPIGGPPIEWLMPFLAGIASNVFSNYLYDILKNKFRDNIIFNFFKRKHLVKKHMRSFKYNYNYIINQMNHHSKIQLSFDPNFEYLISTMPKRKALKILKQLADQHSKDIYSNMKEIYEKDFKK